MYLRIKDFKELTNSSGSGIFVSLKNQFIPVTSIDRQLSLIDFDETGITGFNDVQMMYSDDISNYSNTIIRRRDLYNLSFEYSDNKIIAKVYKSSKIINLLENMFDVLSQTYPEILTLIKEFPEDKRNIISGFVFETLDNNYMVKTHRFSSLTSHEYQYINYKRLKSLIFSKPKVESLPISKIKELKSEIML